MEGPKTPPKVPAGWKAVWSKTKKAYYYISPEGESVWVLPKSQASNLPDGWQRETNKHGKTFYANTITGSSVYEKPTKEISNAIRKSVVERNKGKIVPKALQAYTAAPTAAAAGEIIDLTGSDTVGIPAPETCSLRNPDNVCYINSSIQLLYMVDDFRNKILASRSRNPYIQALRMVFFIMANTPADANGRRIMSPPITQLTMELSDQPGRPFSLRALFSTVTVDYDDDRIGKQMDIAEFMNNLFDKINSQVTRVAEINREIQARQYYNEDRALPDILQKVRVLSKLQQRCIHGGKNPINKNERSYVAELRRDDYIDWTKDVHIQDLINTVERTDRDPNNWFTGCNPPPGIGGGKGPLEKHLSWQPISEYFISSILPHKQDDGLIIRDRPVILDPVITINEIRYGLSGYVLHLGVSIAAGHYVFIKCGPDNKASIVINDSIITPAADDNFGNMEYQQNNAYIVLYKRLEARANLNISESLAEDKTILERTVPQSNMGKRADAAQAAAIASIRLNDGSSLDSLRKLLKVKGVTVYTDAELDAMIGRAVPANWRSNTGTVGWPVRNSSVADGLPVSPATLAAIKAADGTNFNMTSAGSSPGATMSPGTKKQLESFGLLGGRYKKTRKNKSRRRSTRKHLKRKF
jgi:hypothetical protein